MLQPSFGAINLEDIAQPNCFRMLDELRESCEIPVWHDDAQGTACVTLAGLVNALRLANKKLSDLRIVMRGAGAAITSIARVLIADGVDAARIVLFDIHGSLPKDREALRSDARFYRAWELCLATNPQCIADGATACKGADVLIAASAPGPNTIKHEWIRSLADKAIAFACANPVPEIYAYAAREAGVFIVGTGRGDFPNQVNNSVYFPGILKGALLVRARKITDRMAIRAAHAIADSAARQGINQDHIMPTMEDSGVFVERAADVAIQAIEDGAARQVRTQEEVHRTAQKDIELSPRMFTHAMENAFIPPPPRSMLEGAPRHVVEQAR